MSRYEFRERQKLIGGFNCRLTEAESNAWHEFALQTPEHKEFTEVTCELNAELHSLMGNCGDKEKAVKLHKRHEQLGNALFQVGKDWYEKNVAPKIEEEESVK